MCRTATAELLAELVASYNPHLCTVSAGEVSELLKNVMTSCLCSLHNAVV